MSTSKKPVRDTRFYHRTYGIGFTIPLTTFDAADFIGSVGMVIPPPDAPWIPLDEGILEGILQVCKWDADSRLYIEERVSSGTYFSVHYDQAVAIQRKCANNLEQLYMEALWRKINKKNSSA